MLSINHFFRAQIRGTSLEGTLRRLPCRLFFIAVTFFCLNLSWVVFRAPSLDCALGMYQAMFAGGSLMPENGYCEDWQCYALLGACAFICFCLPNSGEILNGRASDGTRPLFVWRPDRAWATGLALLTFVAITMVSRETPFLYFQF